MKNSLQDYQISVLCKARQDLETAFLASYKNMSAAEVERASSSFVLIDEALEDEIQRQEAIYDALLHERERELMPKESEEPGEENIHLRNFKMNNE